MRFPKAAAFLLCILSVNVFIAGCSSGPILASRKETNMPPTDAPLTAIRYYLPAGRVQVSAKWDSLIPGWDPLIKVSAQADPQFCYSIDRDINSRYDDDVSISVDPTTGLLASVTATSTDQTVNALGTILSSTGSFASFATSLESALGLKSRNNSEYAAVTREAFTSQFNVTLTPAIPHAIAYVVSPAADLTRPTAPSPPAAEVKTTGTTAGPAPEAKPPSPPKLLYAKFEMTLEPVNTENSAAPAAAPDNSTVGGIVIRIPVPYILRIAVSYYRQDDPNPRMLKSEETVILPDQDHNYFLPLDRIPLVTSSTKVVLVNGMVQSLQRSRPSTLAAFVGVPKTLLGDLIPMPIAVHQSQTNNVLGTGHATN